MIFIMLAVLIVGFILHKFRQPLVIGYLLVGVFLGSHGLNLIGEQAVLNRMGSIGVLLLLFFMGMEISLPRLLANWRIAVIGTLLEILITVGCIVVLGFLLDWPIARSILLGFVLSISSTAVIIRILQEWKQVNTDIGQDVIGILLVQDLAIIPMLIIIGYLGGDAPGTGHVILQVCGGIAILGLMLWVARVRQIRLPFPKLFRGDHEMQVFTAFLICLGLAFITDLLGLSTALGAFIAGILITSARETHWVHTSLQPFHVVFVAVFFVSVGLLLDIGFLVENWSIILILVLVTFVLNTLINAVIMKLMGVNWQKSLYGGALLSQIGEFSFVIAAVGLQAKIIDKFGYQITISLITITLLLSPFWILMIKRWSKTDHSIQRPPSSS